MSFSIEKTQHQFEFDESLSSRLCKKQYYIPIYNNFFPESGEIMLNYNCIIQKVKSTDEHNSFIGTTINKESVPMFAKFCPLMDPLKVMVGKESVENVSLPTTKEHPFADTNNSAYVDSFFSYLSSKLLHEHGFVHGLDCFGSLLAIQKDFRVNIQDDVEYLFESEHFLEHRDEFNISDMVYEHFQPMQSCKYKRRLTIGDDEEEIKLEIDNLEESPEMSSPVFDFSDCYKNDSDLVYIKDPNSSPNRSEYSGRSSSTCSSRSSVTTQEDDDSQSGSENWETDNESTSEEEEEEEDSPIYATVTNFPVNMVFLEGCKETLDDYMLNSDIKQEEWSAILMQVIMTLLVLQEKFYFIHNDLHTSNIMYVDTDKQYLYYKYGETHYKVPTFGKIWKIIDFGRAIYKFKGKIMFSDSFSENGDASTQYNCEPYLNKEKKIVPPNFSFDLCRLGCSLFDYFDETEGLDAICEVIEDWVRDDKGRNILYKNNGDERYPEFKLYKMITRTVHNTLPKEQLNRRLFSQYSISRKNIKKKQIVLRIDEIPSYVQ